ncbi:MAG: trigger factor, partial [Spirochaetales bacterium]
TQGSGYNLYKIDDDVLGMQPDEEKVVDKTYPEDFEEESLRGTEKKLKIKVKAIKERQLPELDDELAQDVSEKYETIDDLRKDIKERLEKTVDSRVRDQKRQALLDQLVEKTTVPVPESMVQVELENAWHGFVQRLRMDEDRVLQLLQTQGQTKEELQGQWRDDAVKRIKEQLIVGKLLELEGIEADDEEVEAELESQASGGSATKEQLRQYYEQQNMMEYLKREVQERKLFDKLFEESKIKKGKKLGFLDLMGRNE